MVDPPGSAKTLSKRDEDYYFENVIFEVEGSLFSVPKHGFVVAGTPFEKMFTLPPGKTSSTEGQDDEHPIVLPVPRAFFKGFLRVLYPFEGASLTYEDWVGALDLGTMWCFEEIRTKSIGALTILIKSRGAIDKILLAKKYKVLKWLRAGYVQVIRYQTPIDLDNLRTKLNLDIVARLLSIRESILLPSMQLTGSPNNNCDDCQRSLSYGTCAYCPQYPFTDAKVLSHMDRFFQVEFAEMDNLLLN